VREDGRIVGGDEWQGKVYNREMEDAPENGKESSYSARANGINEYICCQSDKTTLFVKLLLLLLLYIFLYNQVKL
jgi:hypothetical protein